MFFYVLVSDRNTVAEHSACKREHIVMKRRAYCYFTSIFCGKCEHVGVESVSVDKSAWRAVKVVALDGTAESRKMNA